MIEKAKINLGRLAFALGVIAYWAAACILVHPYARTDLTETMRIVGAIVIGTIVAIAGAVVIFALFAALFLVPTGLRNLKEWLYGR